MSKPCINLMPALHLLVQVCGSTQETEADGGKDGSNFSRNLQTFYITLFYFHTASAGGWEDRLPGATPSWAGELGRSYLKRKLQSTNI